jgi:hypothetical protein
MECIVLCKADTRELIAIAFLVIVALAPLLLSSKMAEAQSSLQKPADKFSITRAGIYAYNNIAEFGPITIGRASIVNTSSADDIQVFSIHPLGLVSMINQSNPISFYIPKLVSDESILMRNGANVTLEHAILLSNPIYERNTNYIKASFRTLSTINSSDNHNGIMWNDGHREYWAFFLPVGLVLYTNPYFYSVPPNSSLVEMKFASAPHSIGKWNTIEVVYVNDVIHLFLDGEDKIQMNATTTTTNSANDTIRCGLSFMMRC